MDAQLHIVITRLVDKAQRMHNYSDMQEKRKGVVELVGALGNYATYFNDAEFMKFMH